MKLLSGDVWTRKLGKGFPSADFGLSLSGGRWNLSSPSNSESPIAVLLVPREVLNSREDVLITAGVTGGSRTSESLLVSGRKVTTSPPTLIEGLPSKSFLLDVSLDSWNILPENGLSACGEALAV